jgi:hypothetical protein
MRLHVDPWDPSYGVGMDDGDGPADRSNAEVDVSVEMPAADWHPVETRGGTATPEVVYVVDGVRRIDARVWVDDFPGLTASYAAGAVRCDLRAGVAALTTTRVARGLFTSAPDPESVGLPPARYEARHVPSGETAKLVGAAQQRLRGLEVEVSESLSGRDRSGADLVIVDGPLDGRSLPNTLGYVKRQVSIYLPDALIPIVTGLNAGQRSPVFLLTKTWRRYTWYVRLPGPAGSAWTGIVRVECAADLPVDAAIELAHVSTATLPRFASTAYKDPRAPQNLVPIAGLERRLRAMLGDSRILHRSLLRAAAIGAMV